VTDGELSVELLNAVTRPPSRQAFVGENDAPYAMSHRNIPFRLMRPSSCVSDFEKIKGYALHNKLCTGVDYQDALAAIFPHKKTYTAREKSEALLLAIRFFAR
jgi:hypothetical protein